MCLARPLADLLRQAQNEEGRLSLSMHHRGLEELEMHFPFFSMRAHIVPVVFPGKQMGKLVQKGDEERIGV